jgi:hypothetical protein
MHEILRRWGVFAPLAFIAIQALQVVIAPIPGDVTGVLGGFAFGQWVGFIYSTIGLTIGSLLAFWLGRGLGAPFVRRVTGPEIWERLNFVVEAEGAILCLIIFLVPGLPKDTLLPLRCQSDTVLGLCRRLNGRPDARHVGALCRRREGSGRPIHSIALTDGGGRGAYRSALLLPSANRSVASQAFLTSAQRRAMGTSFAVCASSA